MRIEARLMTYLPALLELLDLLFKSDSLSCHLFFRKLEFCDDLEMKKRMGDESRRMESSSEGIYIRRLTGPVSEGESETCD